MAHLERLLKDDDLEKASEEEDGCALKLLDAATSGDEATVSSLLSRQHVQSFINFTDENFCYANDIWPRRGCTPLHLAAARGHGKVVETLVEAKADLFLQDEDQHTPLHMAAFSGHGKMVETLVEAKADPCAQDVVSVLRETRLDADRGMR